MSFGQTTCRTAILQTMPCEENNQDDKDHVQICKCRERRKYWSKKPEGNRKQKREFDKPGRQPGKISTVCTITVNSATSMSPLTSTV